MRKFVATSLVAAMAAAAFGGPGESLTKVIPTATGGADFNATFNSTHTAFDLQLWVDPGFDWTASQVEWHVLPAGQAAGISIWHASDQTLVDPNGPADGDNGNLLPNNAGSAKTKAWDTQMNIPGGGMTMSNFAAPGGIVSTSTDIFGLNPNFAPIPLAFFDIVQNPGANWRAMRLTLEHPDGLQDLLCVDCGVGVPVVELVNGWHFQAFGENILFDHTIYLVPEPATVGLLGLGALATLLRRR